MESSLSAEKIKITGGSIFIRRGGGRRRRKKKNKGWKENGKDFLRSTLLVR